MITNLSTLSKVQQHYSNPNLGEEILNALKMTGKDTNRLTIEDTAPADEFHIRGRVATVELARQLDLHAHHRVLDVGSGIGGASRYLAATYGCRVTGLDLTESFVQTAKMLAERTGLNDLVDYRQGSALEMPFDDALFDVAWTQHVAMNIADKDRLYREIWRVLKPGGRLALYDILAGPQPMAYFPVPWARAAETSFLVTPQNLRGLIEAAGLTIIHWRDVTEDSRAGFINMINNARQNGLPPLGLHIVVGQAVFDTIVTNLLRAFEEDMLRVFEVVARKE